MVAEARKVRQTGIKSKVFKALRKVKLADLKLKLRVFTATMATLLQKDYHLVFAMCLNLQKVREPRLRQL